MTITCLLYNSATLGRIFKLLCRNVPYNTSVKIGYGDLRSRSRLRVRGQRVKNRVRSVTLERMMGF